MAKPPFFRYCKVCGTPLVPNSRFCGRCGARVPTSPATSRSFGCPNCGNLTQRWNRFCPTCGSRLGSLLYPAPSSYGKALTGAKWKHTTLEKVGLGIFALAAVAFFLIVFVNLFVLGFAFYYTLTGVLTFTHVFSLFVPIQIPLFQIEGRLFAVYFSFVIVVILGSFLLLFRNHGRQLLKILRHPVNNSDFLAGNSENPLILIGQLFFATFIFSLLYVGLLWIVLGGALPTAPIREDITFWQLLFLLANAAVYEELIIRVLFIGLPLLIVRGLQQRKLKKGDFKTYLWGGGIEIGKLEFLLLSSSSVIFGLAHVIGWGWWKFGQATLGGMVLGYLFLRFGLHSSIALHFSIDYLPIILVVLELFNLLEFLSFALILFLGLLVTGLLWLIASTYYFVMYFHKVLLVFRTRVFPKARSQKE